MTPGEPGKKNIVQFRAPPTMLQDMDGYASISSSYGETARRDLDTFYAFLAREVRTLGLTRNEACCIADVNNGGLLAEGSLDPGLSLMASIGDTFFTLYPSSYGTKWEIDEAALWAKILAWRSSQRLAAAYGCTRFWALSAEDEMLFDLPDEEDPTDVALRLSGLWSPDPRPSGDGRSNGQLTPRTHRREP